MLPRCENDECRATLAVDGTCHVCAAGGPTRDPEAAWRAWAESRPEGPCRDTARKIKPNCRYKLATTGDDYYHLYSVCEDGTVTVIRFNAATDEPMFRVFGIDPDELIVVEEKPWADFARKSDEPNRRNES